MYEVLETIEEIDDDEVKKIMGKAYSPPPPRSPESQVEMHRDRHGLLSGWNRVSPYSSYENVTGMGNERKSKHS